MANKEKADEAVPFIIYSQKDGFKLNPEAEEYLKSLDQNRKVAVISIVGKYRTGKSFLVNRVLLDKKGKKAGFSVGPTINPCTKGLWLWRECLRNEETKDDVDIILLDTEGFGGMDENSTHDSRIFLFSLLLSSFFIYNSQGNIDETALNNISLIINLSKDIIVSNQDAAEDVAEYFPSFLWVVRDFALQMVDKEGKKITSKDYLEKALENQKGVSDTVEQKNKIRRQLKHFFKDRDCATLVRPVETETDLQRLNELEDQDLRPEFVAQAAALRKRIFKNVKPKMINGRMLSGVQLLEICKAYIEAINKGTLPNIESAWKYMCQSESKKAINDSLEQIKQLFHKQYLSDKTSIPLSVQQLHNVKLQLREQLFKLFKSKSIGSDEDLSEYYQQLDLQYNELFKEFTKLNSDRMQQYYNSQLKDPLSNIHNKLSSDQYENLQQFEAELNELNKWFVQKVGSNQESSEFWNKTRDVIYKQAVDQIGIKIQRQKEKELRILEQKLQMQSQDLQQTQNTAALQKQGLQNKIEALEREKVQWTVTQQFTSQTIQQLQAENEKQKNTIDELRQTNNLQKQQQSQQIDQDKYEQLNQEFEQIKSEYLKSDLAHQKQIALLKQEITHKEKDIIHLNDTNSKQQQQVNKYQVENESQSKIVNQLKMQLNQIEAQKRQEIDKLNKQHSLSIEKLSVNQQQSKSQSTPTAEVQSNTENNYLQTQVNLLQSQLQENKKLQDALLLALQQGLSTFSKKKEDKDNNNQSNNNSLLESNRTLQSAYDQIDSQLSRYNNKIIKLKAYKHLIKNSISIQCLCCSKFIPTRTFQAHLDSCILSPALPSTSQQQQLSQLQTSSMGGILNTNNSITQSQFDIEVSSLSISIPSTIVKESQDHKPYTEYIVAVNYLNQATWKTPKKYKNFCELHQALATQFSGLKFPESSLAIINSTNDAGFSAQNKKPAFIEERRKALQQYVRDLNKIECIRNSKVFRNFLEFDSHTLTTMTKPNPSSSSIMASSFIRQSIKNNEKENDQKNLLSQYQSSQQGHQFNSLVGSLNQQQALQLPTSEKRIGGVFIESWQNKEKENNQKNFNNGRSKSMASQLENFQFAGEKKIEQNLVSDEGEAKIDKHLSPSLSLLPNQQRNSLGGSLQQRHLAQSLSATNANLLIQKSSPIVPLSSVSKSQTYTYNFIKTQQQRSPVAGKQFFQDKKQQDPFSCFQTTNMQGSKSTNNNKNN